MSDMESFQEINIETWKRKQHFLVFRGALQPEYCVNMNLDVTTFLQKIKESNRSFTLAFIYIVTRCANNVEEFRYRLVDDKVLLYDKIGTSFTYLDRDTELFKMVNVDMQDSISLFEKEARQTIIGQKEYFNGAPPVDSFIFSAMPWIRFTSISHTISTNKSKGQPLFDWGKFFEQDGRVLMPFSIQVHHSFVDGIHLGKLVDKIQKSLDHPTLVM
jgi:chloramphenicol O-acetyltransferase type B